MRDALQAATAALSAPSSAVWEDTPALDAEVLLRHVLGLSRAELYTHPERLLTPSGWRRYRALLRRRAGGEPVAHLTGGREFMGLTFEVSPSVLTPRPETEVLVERALALVPGNGNGRRAADVGTGSGAIAISLATARPALSIVATDVSPAALAVARRNARRLLGDGWRRVRFVKGSLLEPVLAPVDVIAANLPYIPAGEMPALPAPVRDFEPSLALDGGPDGLDLYRALLPQSKAKLAPGGSLLMECDPRQAPGLAALVETVYGPGSATVHKDLAGRNRVVEATARK